VTRKRQMQIIETNSNRAPIVVVYGNEGRGKTSLASRFHNAVWFLLERGLPRGVTVEAAEGVDSFEGVMNGLRHLYSAEHTYQTLVVDTLDAFEPHLLEHVCATNRWRNIEQPSYGKGWVAADETWRRFLVASAPCAKNAA
jgi:AAA domain